MPDVEIADIGYHYNLEGYVNAGIRTYVMDFNVDAGVDANDLLIFTSHWLENPGSQGYDARMEFVDANRIDFRDFAMFAGQWKKRTAPIPPDIAPTFDQDPNNLKGDVSASILNLDGVYRATLLLDGCPAGIFYDDGDGPKARLDTREYANGWHKAKFVLLTQSAVFLTSPTQVYVNNDLSVLTRPHGFTVGKDYCIYALSDPNTYVLRIYDVNDSVVFEQDCNDGLNVCVPGATFKDDSGMMYLEVSYALSSSVLSSQCVQSLSSTGGDITIPKTPVPDDFDRRKAKNKNPQIIISIGDVDNVKTAGPFWASCLQAATRQRMRPVVLAGRDCTWSNLQFCLEIPTVKLWYHVGHGYYQVQVGEGQRQRPVIWLADGRGLFSHLRTHPSSGTPCAPDLGLIYESEFAIRDLGSQVTGRLIWVQFDTCYSGKTDEFAKAFGMIDDSGDPVGNRIFVGWKDKIDPVAREYEPRYDLFEASYWVSLGGGVSMMETLQVAFVVPGGVTIWENFITYGITVIHDIHELQSIHFRANGL